MFSDPVQPAHERWQGAHTPELSYCVEGHVQVPNTTVLVLFVQVKHYASDGPLQVAQLA